MTKRHLPSIEALTASDDDLLSAELRLSEVRAHVELARSLLEELELGVAGPARADLAGALAQLGCRIFEMAGALGAVSSPRSTHCAEARPEPHL